MSWNDENVARLKELWDQGLPTAQIGKLLSFTKNYYLHTFMNFYLKIFELF